MGERVLEYQGDSLIRWHISHLFPDTFLPHLCTSPWQRQEGTEPWKGCWEYFKSCWDLVGTFCRPSLPLPHTPTALGLALVLPKHDCPSLGKRKGAHDGVKQVENRFHSPRDFSALSVTPLLDDHGAQGCRGAQSPCTDWEKGL